MCQYCLCYHNPLLVPYIYIGSTKESDYIWSWSAYWDGSDCDHTGGYGGTLWRGYV